ncbi:olfactory receptor 52K1-like [Callorhinchus milii]|uniref:olfactory receptor 52K1-like n=1 Tax=Callorhinchus milii TaxID=7868 RepID=UPI001C3F99E1|nr:olfactory receptor 52K1-like [Callorhinchus milii]
MKCEGTINAACACDRPEIDFPMNVTERSSNVTLTGFCGEPCVNHVLQSFSIIMYILCLLFNFLVIFGVFLSRQLKKPMYLLMLNLAITDLVGCSANVCLVFDMFFSGEQFVSKEACFVQVFFVYLFGGLLCGAITTMAVDRFIAICHPFSYLHIFKWKNILKIMMAVWAVSLVMAFVYVGLCVKMLRQPVVVRGLMCDHLSLSNVVQDRLNFDFIYNVFMSVGLILVCSALQCYTYRQIFAEINKSNDREMAQSSKSKLVKHLFIPLSTYVVGFSMLCVTIVDHFVCHPYVINTKVIFQFIYYTTVPVLNPIIYGLHITELRKHLLHFLNTQMVSLFS